MGFKLEQVQDFTPTPMTVGTVIYYSGLHPYTLRPVYAATSKKEKKNQHLFFFWHKNENHQTIRDKLKSMGREDLVDKLIGERKKQFKRDFIKKRRKNSTAPERRSKRSSRRQSKRK